MLYLLIILVVGALALTFWAHYFIFNTLVNFFGISGRLYLNFLRAAFIILPLSFIAASILISHFANLLVRLYYAVAAVWLGAVLYLFLASLLSYFILYLSRFFSWNLNPKYVAVVLFAIALAAVIYGLTQAQNIAIKKLSLSLPNLPAGWRGKTLVWTSDLHLGAINNYKFAERIVSQINSIKPDLLLIGGDLFDGQKNVDLTKLAGAFSAIKAPLGKFFITGNHEEFGDNREFIKAVNGAGITYLNNQLKEINGLQLIGVDYHAAYDKTSFAEILKNLKIDSAKPSLLLRHVPDKIEVAAAAGISLVICGHTHRGQVWPAEIVPHLLYDGFAYGLKKFGSTQVYTSSGTGTWGPPLRIFARPEIVRITLE